MKNPRTSQRPQGLRPQSSPAHGSEQKGLRPINRPRGLRVQTDDRSRPQAVTFVQDRPNRPPSGRPHQVETIDEVWRIVDEWWRVSPITRTYYRVNLDDGRPLTLFHDEIADTWFEQRY